MSAVPPEPPQYEFDANQSAVFRDLSRAMALVGLVMILFGILQVVNGVMTVIASRNPEATLQAARDAGVPDDKVKQIEQAMTKDGFASPLVMGGIAMALAGLVLLIVGVWTRQGAASFALVANTSGQDINWLMNGLVALRKIYGLQYTFLVVAALMMLASFIASLWFRWKGA
jgi:hypothetical protein